MKENLRQKFCVIDWDIFSGLHFFNWWNLKNIQKSLTKLQNECISPLFILSDGVGLPSGIRMVSCSTTLLHIFYIFRDISIDEKFYTSTNYFAGFLFFKYTYVYEWSRVNVLYKIFIFYNNSSQLYILFIRPMSLSVSPSRCPISSTKEIS